MKLSKNILSEEIVPLSSKQSVILYIIIACIFQFSLFFAPALADEAVALGASDDFLIQNEEIIKTEYIASTSSEQSFPKHEDVKPIILDGGRHVMTAYNSEPGQTDDSPCITANGFNVCEHGIEDTIAANFLKFGTKVRIPELFGDRIFIVRDRMNKRYSSRVDIWMLDHSDAIQFGVRVARIEIVE